MVCESYGKIVITKLMLCGKYKLPLNSFFSQALNSLVNDTPIRNAGS